MTVHITHDFLTIATASSPTANMYYLTLFLTGVLGFTRVGQTGMNILPQQSGTVASNKGASINLGTNKEYYVSVPTASYVVPVSSDNDKILVLKSVDFSKTNSGLFRVLSGSVADNAFIIDYRTPSGSYPPIESGSLSGSIDWMLFASENTFAQTEGGYVDNGSASNGYQTYGTATYPRIILKSSNSLGWQVRICAESADDRFTVGGLNTGNTISVGVSGNLLGDFSVGGEHTHGALFWNDNQVSRRRGQQVGIGPTLSSFLNWKTGQWRVYMWGDDQTGSMFILNRNVSIGASAMCLFGMPEQEPIPIPTRIVHRLFTIGSAPGTGDPNGPTWNVAEVNGLSYAGQAFGFSNKPISCVMSSYHLMYADSAPRNLVTSDNPIFGATELIPVDLLAGTWLTNYIESTPFIQNLPLEPRRMGIVPIARQGRSNFGDWITDTNKTWFHTKDGMYFPWSGLPVLP